ncbi:MAG: ABC-type lipid A exporter permease and ATPase components MsbA [Saliniramus fredricksonii]|uniref:ABC-type lipid A exporter permease and ATPase components MsbA n=1 Tax=Saliniramus fredricksonii TaxID=1653334 RepID=A0A0P8AA60_9HYPH|nr:ABC transporter ATP-binding protein [Saliniramus fredricksonii]KPQ11977.1 MAG: ABC-type lipid A exporter permease and ATPase components MsbA [Saliniramus fredricksonii]SCC81528.1 ATP-binding cassette, subfamily B, MsbA [Saliniramus fredricksonii]
MARKAFTLDSDTVALLKRLWRERVAHHRRSLVLIMILIVIGGAATSLYPLLIREAFDALDMRNMQILYWGPLVVILVTSIKGFALYGQVVLTNVVVCRVEADMQSALYAHLIDLDLAQLQKDSPATLTQRFTTDFTFIKEALTRLVTVFLREAVTVIALVGAMFWIDWLMTLVVILVAPFVAPPIARIGKKLRRVSTATQEEIGSMAGMVSESLGGVKVAKTYAMEPYLKGRARDAFEQVRALKVQAARARARLDPILEISAGFAVAGVLALIGWQIGRGETTIGDFTGFVTALLLAAQPVRALGNLNATVQEAIAALVRYYDVIGRKPQIAEKPAAPALAISDGTVRFENAGFSYGDQAESVVPALTGIDLIVAGGSTTALVGRSGSGKSTLLSLIPRLYDVTQGRVLIDGQDVRDVSLASLRGAISVVSQEVMLFDDTVRANIGFGRPGAGEEAIIAAARNAAAHDFISALPEGYDTRVGPAGSRLSGGERQRVSLARAFLKDAPILLLDEATSALDAESEKLVQEALARLMQGRTTLVIAHRLSTVRNADLIVVLEGGVIVQRGNHEALIAEGGAYSRLHALQNSGA